MAGGAQAGGRGQQSGRRGAPGPHSTKSPPAFPVLAQGPYPVVFMFNGFSTRAGWYFTYANR